MSHFHDHFKTEFNSLYELADGTFAKRGMSLNAFLNKANELIHYLTIHHTIEERHIFPVLAKRMPMFAMENDGVHLESHKGIHHGLEDLTNLVTKYKKDPTSYKPEEFRACLDSWRQVLFTHLDDEVADLKGENMKKYWTLAEVDRIPM
ncbi:uncharacterized protein STEHIDRAFT_141577 [Stereum hirsutum FP-91666 SS1]|uniref:uncharacterized protein n=1 Tax=Stereum hirsutum (strain FP-91666) TaxID=721885 RepID=UPI0004449656|nr:uncharacterized protein STEHIDRAFT_141577 [Stereum hirsutum FP-91666 SS1]EIM83064.1 hypothetical protein STEHIDRAFT_141577 [Stereum hirsutum FP-91666 SS1]